MATNRELIAKLKDKFQVVASLAAELDYNECTLEERDEVQALCDSFNELVTDLAATVDAMNTTIGEDQEQEVKDRSANEDDSDEE